MFRVEIFIPWSIFLSCEDTIQYVVSVEILVMLISDQVDLAGVTHLFAVR